MSSDVRIDTPEYASLLVRRGFLAVGKDNAKTVYEPGEKIVIYDEGEKVLVYKADGDVECELVVGFGSVIYTPIETVPSETKLGKHNLKRGPEAQLGVKAELKIGPGSCFLLTLPPPPQPARPNNDDEVFFDLRISDCGGGDLID